VLLCFLPPRNARRNGDFEYHYNFLDCLWDIDGGEAPHERDLEGLELKRELDRLPAAESQCGNWLFAGDCSAIDASSPSVVFSTPHKYSSQ
jgi:hypothetical protein